MFGIQENWAVKAQHTTNASLDESAVNKGYETFGQQLLSDELRTRQKRSVPNVADVRGQLYPGGRKGNRSIPKI